MGRELRRLPFRYCEAFFFGGLLDDPLLYLQIRPEGRALLFDCGQIAHLSKRVVKPISAVFISHAHMDHVMGVPTLVRHHHASPLPLDLYGPEGIATRIEHQLMGYDWNLCEPTWFTLRVHEIHPQQILHYRFPGPDCFARHFEGAEPRTCKTIWSSRYVSVAAEILDHKMPVLAFRVTEHPPFSIDPCLLEEQGLLPGDWIRDLKSRVWKGNSGTAVAVTRRDGNSVREESADDPVALYAKIRKEETVSSLGYFTDAGWTPENISRLEEFFPKLTLLCSECTFMEADEGKARASYHLCSRDLNELTARLAPRYLLPMHLSKSYLHRTVDLFRELHPPEGTTVIRLPGHVVPLPLMTKDVKGLLKP